MRLITQLSKGRTGYGCVFTLAVISMIVSGGGAIPTQEKRRPIPMGPPEETSLFVAYSDRGDVLYSSRLLQLGAFDANGKNVRHLELTGFNALSVMFFPHGKQWLAASGDEADLRDGITGKIQTSIKAQGGRIAAVSIGEKSDNFLLVSEKKVEMYRATDCSLLMSFDSDATRAAISADGSFIIAVDKVGRVEKAIVKTGKIERTATITLGRMTAKYGV
jgi:hypothetical protein